MKKINNQLQMLSVCFLILILICGCSKSNGCSKYKDNIKTQQNINDHTRITTCVDSIPGYGRCGYILNK